MEVGFAGGADVVISQSSGLKPLQLGDLFVPAESAHEKKCDV